jgi:hypothetical protein
MRHFSVSENTFVITKGTPAIAAIARSEQQI